MTHSETVGMRLQELRRGLERHGVKSPWGKLRVTGFDEQSLSVTLETSNYMFYQRYKTSRLVVSIKDLVEREDLVLDPDDRAAVQDLYHSMERERTRVEQERQAREQARKDDEERRRRREEADKRTREAAKRRSDERRRRRERESLLHDRVTSIGFPAEEKRKEISDLARDVDKEPSLANAFRLAAQHLLSGRPERATVIWDEAERLQREGRLDAETLKAVAREPQARQEGDHPASSDMEPGYRTARALQSLEHGDVGRAYLRAAEALRALYFKLLRALNSPPGDPARPALNPVAASLFGIRLKPYLLREASAKGEAYLEGMRARGDQERMAEAQNDLALTYLSRGLHDQVAAAQKEAEAFAGEAPAGGESEDARRIVATNRLLRAWTRLVVDEKLEDAVEGLLEAARIWPGLIESEAWDVFVWGTDPHVRPRLLSAFMAQLAERLEPSSPAAAARVRADAERVVKGSIAGE